MLEGLPAAWGCADHVSCLPGLPGISCKGLGGSSGALGASLLAPQEVCVCVWWGVLFSLLSVF